jgi:dTDP-4-dehydrorhamnose 3,5-epimerase
VNFDVAVDIRINSRTFGKWVGEYISAEKNKFGYQKVLHMVS